MAGNALPIWPKIPKIGGGQLTTTAVTGADMTNALLIFTADATNGSILYEVRVKALPTATTAATAFRVFINNNGTLSTTTNNTLIAEISLPIITVSSSGATPDYSILMTRGGIILPPSYRVYACQGTAQTTAVLAVTAFGGDF